MDESSITNDGNSVRLQWGRGGWPADGSLPWSAQGPPPPLQWGRGGWPADGGTVTSLVYYIDTGFNGAAGVGPRMAMRTICLSRESSRFNGAAGVGPRMGSISSTVSGTSRGFNGAAGVGPRMDFIPNVDVVPDTSFNGAAGVGPRMEKALRTTPALSSRFNGAAGVGPRMVFAGLRLCREQAIASMGPRGLARGWKAKQVVLYVGQSFNGAAGVGPRMEGVACAERGALCRFNGAAGVGPRMAKSASPLLALLSLLQWGRGGWPADGGLLLSRPCGGLEASMGPRGLARGWWIRPTLRR